MKKKLTGPRGLRMRFAAFAVLACSVPAFADVLRGELLVKPGQPLRFRAEDARRDRQPRCLTLSSDAVKFQAMDGLHVELTGAWPKSAETCVIANSIRPVIYDPAREIVRAAEKIRPRSSK